jgi:ApbE superfamily uncharacterized protein (UPF0280 family)
MSSKRFRSFTVKYLETDLWIGVDENSYSKSINNFCLEKIKIYRELLDNYILKNKSFKTSFVPIPLDPSAPSIASDMMLKSQNSSVGPMACVAGAFSDFLAKDIIENFHPAELIIENGGDVFILSKEEMKVAVYAGKSPLSGKIGISIPAEVTPLGVCTSSATVGPSISLGKTDATMIVCSSAALADGYASFFGNQVNSPADIDKVINSIKNIPEIISAIIVCKDKFGICGKLKLEIFKAA